MDTSFSALPRELVIKVLERVASDSSVDLHSVKQCCKKFLEAAEEDSIHREVSLERIPVVQWRDENDRISNFLEKCRQSNNPEALFRKAVVDYFGGKDPNNAFESLEKVAESGHDEASYTLAIILLLRGDELKQRGVKLLTEMKKSNMKKRKFHDSRQKLKNILKSIWVQNTAILNQPPPTYCTVPHKRRKIGWDGEFEDLCEEDSDCIGCLCDEEIIPICEALPKILH